MNVWYFVGVSCVYYDNSKSYRIKEIILLAL